MAKRTCSVEGCERIGKIVRGMCNSHYARQRRHGDPLAGGHRNAVRQPCAIDGCSELSRARGWCKDHYFQWWSHGNPRERRMHPKRTPPLVRFLAQIDESQPGSCWDWRGTVNRKGYGMFHDGKLMSAHRWAYMWFHGLDSLPPDLQIDHLCRNRRCENPLHMELVTNRENVIRGNLARGPVTHCKRGHEFTEANTYRFPSGLRRCRTCHRAWERERRLRCVSG